VTEFRGRCDRATFQYDASPFVDSKAGIVAGPWSAELLTSSSRRLVCGMDTIAYRDGKIYEYWTISKDVKTVGSWTSRSVQAGGELQRDAVGPAEADLVGGVAKFERDATV
jgi:hypothetical protein